MANKNYTISIDKDLMDKFQQSCREKNIKYSNQIELLVKMYLDGKLVLTDKADESLENVKECVNTFEKMVKDLRSVLGEDKAESNNEDWG